MTTDLIFFGMQGSGKGTQGKILAEKLNLQIFETGGALRKIAAEDSDLGRKVKQITEAGHLVPNDIVMDIIADFLQKIPPEQRVLFDGIPRKEEQRLTFENLLKKSGRQAQGIYIKISNEEAIKRLGGRQTCPQCKEIYGLDHTQKNCAKCGTQLAVRSDDQSTESIRNRLQAFEKETAPVIEKYKTENRLIEIDGMQDKETVTQEVLEKVK